MPAPFSVQRLTPGSPTWVGATVPMSDVLMKNSVSRFPVAADGVE